MSVGGRRNEGIHGDGKKFNLKTINISTEKCFYWHSRVLVIAQSMEKGGLLRQQKEKALLLKGMVAGCAIF